MSERGTGIDRRQEFIGAFVLEAEELIGTAGACLIEVEIALDEGTSRPRAVRDLFRALHTIKGLASMMGVEPIVEIAHALETLVRAADGAGGTLRRGAVEISLEGVAGISERVRAVAEQRVVAATPAGLVEAIEAIAATAAGAGVTHTTMWIPREWEPRLSPSERQQLALALQARDPVWTLSFSPSKANAARGIRSRPSARGSRRSARS